MEFKRRTPGVVLTFGLLATILVGGCGQAATPVAPSVTSPESPLSQAITTRDAFVLIHNNTDNPGFVIIDVRTASEFNGGHIAGAVNVDYYSPDFRSIVGTLDRRSRYLVYCRTGIAARQRPRS